MVAEMIADKPTPIPLIVFDEESEQFKPSPELQQALDEDLVESYAKDYPDQFQPVMPMQNEKPAAIPDTAEDEREIDDTGSWLAHSLPPGDRN